MQRLVAILISTSMMLYASQAPVTANATERHDTVLVESQVPSSAVSPVPCDPDAAPDFCINDQLKGHMYLSPYEGSEGAPNYIRGPVEPQHDPKPPWYDPDLSMPGFRPDSRNTDRKSDG